MSTPKNVVVAIHKSEYHGVWKVYFDALASIPGISKCIYREPSYLENAVNGAVVLKVGNSVFLGNELFNAIGEALTHASVRVFCCDDYAEPPATQYRKHLEHLGNNYAFTTVSHFVMNAESVRWKWLHPINVPWTYLAWENARRTHVASTTEKSAPYSMLYFGAFRKNRASSFKKYFTEDAPYKTVISTGESHRKKFAEVCGSHVGFTNRIKNFSVLEHYGSSIYITDDASMLSNMCIGNRFFESVGHNLPMFVDEDCCATFYACGLELHPSWVINSPDDVVVERGQLAQQIEAIDKFDPAKRFRAVLRKGLEIL